MTSGRLRALLDTMKAEPRGETLSPDSMRASLEAMKAAPYNLPRDAEIGPALTERQQQLHDDYMVHPEQYDVRVEYVGEATYIYLRRKQEVSGCK